VTHGFGDG